MKSIDWIGYRNGRLTIIAFEGLVAFDKSKAATFRFLCDCGVEFVAQKSNIIPKRTHCGCERNKRGGPAEGPSSDPIHKVWWHMIDRCLNPQNKAFKDYGAKGIGVCDRWRFGEDGLTGVECFTVDMGPRAPGMTIERTDETLGYWPENSFWLSRSERSRSKREVARHAKWGTTKKTLE